MSFTLPSHGRYDYVPIKGRKSYAVAEHCMTLPAGVVPGK